MNPGSQEQDATAWVYLLAIAATGLLLYLRDNKNTRASPLTAWDIKAVDFLCFIWVIAMLFVFAPSALAKIFFEGSESYEHIPLPVIALLHTLPLVLAYGIIIRFTPLLTGILPSKSDALHSAFRGIASFLKTFPLVLIAGVVWALFIMLLEEAGLPVSFEAQAYISTLLESDRLSDWAIMAIAATVLAPITEEITFRAVLFRYLHTRIPPYAAYACSAALFAAAHSSLSQFLPLFILGIFLAKSYRESGNILTPILFHAAFNLNTIVLLLITA